MERPSHFFLSDSGSLHDTRLPDWSAMPLRPVYCGHCPRVDTVAQLKACLRAGSSTDLGGYPLYFVTNDGAALSFEAVRENFGQVVDAIANRLNDGWRVVACDVNWESDLLCDHTGRRIPSAYGNDEWESDGI